VRKIEQVSELIAGEATDPAWAALSSDEQIESDPARYYRIAWAETYRDAERQIAEEAGYDRWHERRQQPQRVAPRSFASAVLNLMGGARRTPKHRANTDV
jgi:hypothetical protein